MEDQSLMNEAIMKARAEATRSRSKQSWKHKAKDEKTNEDPN